jgi:hypothetical protein
MHAGRQAGRQAEIEEHDEACLTGLGRGVWAASGGRRWEGAGEMGWGQENQGSVGRTGAVLLASDGQRARLSDSCR